MTPSVIQDRHVALFLHIARSIQISNKHEKSIHMYESRKEETLCDKTK